MRAIRLLILLALLLALVACETGATATSSLRSGARARTPTSEGQASKPTSEGQASDGPPGTAVPSLGADHIAEGEQGEYNSDPPTSGPHYGRPASWGFQKVPPPDESLVHNLEHGGVVIYYQPGALSDDELVDLQKLQRQLSQINPRLVLTPREQLDAAIALTSWGYLQFLESYDPKAIRAFFTAHIARGPECEAGQCPG